ncbi:uncharacterized protein LOC116163191 [Photinus pyralis]|uniref:uncharacterized protein LOC116163191 n=1 Tax=Photinus pyralis TaxID=7054 RepID=UPI00126717B5|nr:uncharacterized protein LOC116163191 [Photinus pyralis]
MDSYCTPPDVEEVALAAVENLLPTKSKDIYDKACRKFIDWCKQKNAKTYSEHVLLAYFSELKSKENKKCSTLWSTYSMIKSILNVKHGVDISKYLKLRAFLKRQNEGHIPKKSKVFTKNEFDAFINNAPDNDYLGMKIALIIGIAGACRCDEIVKMKTEDIEDLGSLLHIQIPDSKTNKTRSFTVIGAHYIGIYRKYVNVRPANMNNSRFFLKFAKGKCHRAVMGIHFIGEICRKVASYLNLKNPKEYTGHCMRRTSATLLVDAGADITCLKRHGGWKSNCVAEGYIEDSISNKNEIAQKILSTTLENPGLSDEMTSTTPPFEVETNPVLENTCSSLEIRRAKQN